MKPAGAALTAGDELVAMETGLVGASVSCDATDPAAAAAAAAPPGDDRAK